MSKLHVSDKVVVEKAAVIVKEISAYKGKPPALQWDNRRGFLRMLEMPWTSIKESVSHQVELACAAGGRAGWVEPLKAVGAQWTQELQVPNIHVGRTWCLPCWVLMLLWSGPSLLCPHSSQHVGECFLFTVPLFTGNL